MTAVSQQNEKPFQSDYVLEERISTDTLRAYHIGYEGGRFRLEPLADVLESVIPEFALGPHDACAPANQWIGKCREAARTVYTTAKYKRRGEFGELVLHLLLRDFCSTTPLVSKIFFKDADNATAHGFDGVQVSECNGERKLWLGESKFYEDGRTGIRDLMTDLKRHLTAQYLRREFALISKKIPLTFTNRDHWVRLMHRHRRLDEVFKSVVVPMVCTYTSKTVAGFTKECNEYFAAFDKECTELGTLFHEGRQATECEVILLLLPVHDKKKLCKELHDRLMSLQRGSQK